MIKNVYSVGGYYYFNIKLKWTMRMVHIKVANLKCVSLVKDKEHSQHNTFFEPIGRLDIENTSLY